MKIQIERKFKFIEPELIKAGSDKLRLGLMQSVPRVDCRVLSEDTYQQLKKVYDLYFIEVCQAKDHNDDIRLCGQCMACGGAVAIHSSVLLANELLPHVSQLLIDFNKWQQENIHFVLKLDEKELVEEFIKSINCD